MTVISGENSRKLSARFRVLEQFEESGDDWLKGANESIRTHRMTDAKIRVVDKDGKPVAGAKISVIQTAHTFRFGANIFMLEELETGEKNEIYKEKFKKLFNMATLPFYWDSTEPKRGSLRYDIDSPRMYRRPAIDLCMKFCEENGIEPREHALAYNFSFPAWVDDMSESELKSCLEERYRQISERYADRIETIEVVNEMFRGKWHNAFYKSSEYVDFCFKLARKYFPSNRLSINDGGNWIWNTSTEENSYYKLIRDNISKGVPIDAVGLQFHVFDKCKDEYAGTRGMYSPKALNDTMNLFATLGLPFQVTEITIPAYIEDSEERVGEEIQARLAEYLYTIWFSHPNTEQIIYWNLIDGYAYVSSADPEVIGKSLGDMSLGENVYRGGLLRFDLTEKPIYKKLDELINHRWHTSESLISNTDGIAEFSGFLGEYEITATLDSEHGRSVGKSVTLVRNGNNEILIRI